MEVLTRSDKTRQPCVAVGLTKISNLSSRICWGASPAAVIAFHKATRHSTRTNSDNNTQQHTDTPHTSCLLPVRSSRWDGTHARLRSSPLRRGRLAFIRHVGPAAWWPPWLGWSPMGLLISPPRRGEHTPEDMTTRRWSHEWLDGLRAQLWESVDTCPTGGPPQYSEA